MEAGSRAAGFVNAVLRRVGERDEKAWVQQLAPDAVEDPLGHTAFAHAHPRWIAQAFADALGRRGRAGRGARRRRRPPRGAPARPAGRDHRRGAGPRHRRHARRPTRPTACTWRRAAATSGELDAVARGPGHRAGRGQPARGARRSPGRRWSAPTPAAGSTCAPGPAGKSVLLGSLLAHRRRQRWTRWSPASTAPTSCAAPSTACRWTCTPPTAARPRCPTAPTTGCSWTPPAPGSARCDGGPRPAGGAAPTTWPALTKLQRELLTAALRHVRPGGVVAYVTCSPHLAETRGVLRPVLRRHRDVEQLDARPLLPGVPRPRRRARRVQLWPHRHGTDAMFLVLRRPLTRGGRPAARRA